MDLEEQNMRLIKQLSEKEDTVSHIMGEVFFSSIDLKDLHQPKKNRSVCVTQNLCDGSFKTQAIQKL